MEAKSTHHDYPQRLIAPVLEYFSTACAPRMSIRPRCDAGSEDLPYTVFAFHDTAEVDDGWGETDLSVVAIVIVAHSEDLQVITAARKAAKVELGRILRSQLRERGYGFVVPGRDSLPSTLEVWYARWLPHRSEAESVLFRREERQDPLLLLRSASISDVGYRRPMAKLPSSGATLHLDRWLGNGNFSAGYAATLLCADHLSSRKVVYKRLLHTKHANSRRMLSAEVRAYCALGDDVPFVTRMVDSGDDSVIIEPMGVAMRAASESSPPLGVSSSPFVPKHAMQLLDALNAMHRKGVAHGDVGISNILVEPLAGDLLLTDMSHATMMSSGEGSLSAFARDLRGAVKAVLRLCRSKSEAGEPASRVASEDQMIDHAIHLKYEELKVALAATVGFGACC